MVSYRVARESSLGSFTEACEIYLSSGYVPLGGVGYQESFFIQAFIKTEEEKDKVITPKKKRRSRPKKAVKKAK